MGETRTHTPLKALDFESSSATITTPWHIIENKRISVVTFLKSHCDDIPHHQDVQRRNFTYIKLLSSPSISGEYCMEAPTLDSQYDSCSYVFNELTIQI